MARQELEAALRRDGAEQARQIWQEAEAEAAQLRKTTETTLRNLQQDERRQLEALCTRRVEEVVSARRLQLRRCRLEAEQQLAARLAELARTQLPGLAARGGTELFAVLAAEIPPGDWRRVRVNERDRAFAQERFPRAEVVADIAISGGLAVEDAAGGVTVVNTLAKRLEHFWPLLLPGLMVRLRQWVNEDETA